jgi:hypothetical protein
VPEDNKVEKLRDHGYMNLGYSGFVNDVKKKRVDAPTKDGMGFFSKEIKAIKDGDENLCIC